MISSFTIADKTYSIRLTNHAQQRLTDRQIDLYQVTGSYSLGQKTITAYSAAIENIFIMDKAIIFSIVCNIEKLYINT